MDSSAPSVPALVCRPARPEDTAAIEALDGSFTTDTVYEVTVTDEGFALRAVPVDPPLLKVFPEDDDGEDEESGSGDEDGSRTVVACHGDELCGFVRTSFEEWNARLTVRDIEVAPARRGQGVGRALMNQALDEARRLGAAHVWLEVSSVNVPAIRAYRRMGFAFCGLDTRLYEGTESAGEAALFMARSVV